MACAALKQLAQQPFEGPTAVADFVAKLKGDTELANSLIDADIVEALDERVGLASRAVKAYIVEDL